MDDQTHTDLLRLQSLDPGGITAFCPEDQQIAEYFDGDLGSSERDTLERHLADCRYCLARVGVMNRLQQSDTACRVPENLLATAKQLQNRIPPKPVRRVPAWAAAAVIIMALATMFAYNQKESENAVFSMPGADLTTGEPTSQLRRIKPESAYLDVLTPATGAEIAPGEPVRWAAVPGSLDYSIFILNLAGDVLWTERLDQNEWLMRNFPQSDEKQAFYVRIEAHLADGRTIRSKHRLFHIPDRL